MSVATIPPAIDPAAFKSLGTLTEGLDAMLAAAPKETGTLDLIVSRPAPGERDLPAATDVTCERGIPGDHWFTDRHFVLDDGSPDPDAQICIMMSGCIRAIAGEIGNWAPAGDNFFIDMDLTPANMPPGTAFSIGTAEFVVTALPHNGCQQFIDRYGRDACLFVNTGPGKTLRLRGIYARVTRPGTVTVGDPVHKINA